MNDKNYQDKSSMNQDGEWIKKSVADKKVKKVVIISTVAVIFLSIFINFLIVRTNVIFSGDDIKIQFGNTSTKGNVVSERNESKSSSEYEAFEKKMKNIYTLIHGVYDGPIKDKDLFDEAYKGMVSALGDRYSAYMNEEDYELSRQSIKGSYVGIGIVVGVSEEGVIVISPFKGSPAEKAGLLPGDIISQVNGIEIGDNLEKAVSMMRGEEGGLVNIKIQRKETELFDVEIKRAEIHNDSVITEKLDDNIAYVGITQFGETTAKEFETKIDEIKKSGAKGLVVDLRGNPGGLVDTCIDITSQFIPKDEVITYTIDKNESKYTYKSKGGKLQDIPVVVLINEGSASASEIFSGALRDYKRGVLIGTKSFGKGIVQTMLSRKIDGFGDGTALKLTFSRYYTPNGENIHGKGIMPNIEIEMDKDNYVRGDRSTDNQLQKAIEVLNEKILELK